ncbi:aminoacyl-tRNA hydrolase [Bythopirellula polymerisocia]|uniref:Peptidyl-tRNA hydrolase n=1 Tax=Bythopirellula polymerisocia TaxID=2528003 RepID=A0A5C6CZY0_9BACT|nr:aminoacyl-tRNA hydrolase [Bythopirellula polymerisocia]TWU28506.1 Peptidyl-tRNA hydrolase [Bythopirellula polymerisocia]
MKLVAGLGNPGKKYEGTRHNIGFEVIQLLAQGFATATGRLKFEGHLQECLVGTEKTLLLMPQTFMNLSGRSIRQVMDFYKIDNEDLLVVCDDFNIPLGTLRLRAAGSDGGQKGLASTFGQLGTDRISRLRLGIGPVPAEWDPVDYVLGKFTSLERKVVKNQTTRAVEAIEVWISEGINLAMSQFNGSLPE